MYHVGGARSVLVWFEKNIIGITEEHSRTTRKHVWFFAHNLRMERGSVDTDIIVCTMSIPINLSGLKN